MYYLYYFIRIFREIFGRRKLKQIIILALVIIFLMFISSKLGAFATENVIDINQSIYSSYESVASDFLNRLNFYSSSSSIGVDTKENIINLLKNGNYNYYIYYNDNNGTSMVNGSTFNSYSLKIAFFEVQNVSLSNSIYENYLGYTTQISRTNNIYQIFTFENGNITSTSYSDFIHFPYLLYNYKPQVITNFLNTNDTDKIVTAIEGVEDSITSTDFDENEVDINTSTVDSVDDSTYNGLFTTIFNNFNNSISRDSVEIVSIPIPNTNDTIDIPSNIVSSHLGSLVLLINAFWFYLFGLYAFKFINNLIVHIKDGSILEGYSGNEVISSSMM